MGGVAIGDSVIFAQREQRSQKSELQGGAQVSTKHAACMHQALAVNTCS